MKISRRGQVDPFLILESFREAKVLERQGRDMIHLSLGQPGREAPQAVLEEISQAMLSQPLGYTESPGYLPLRERIQRHYRESYGIEPALERIFITVGSSAAFYMSLIAAFDAGDKVAIALPHYPAYPNMMQALDLEPLFLRPGKERRFQPTVEMLRALPEKPQGLVIASPSNPAGTILDAEEIKRLCDYCEAEGIRILSDEIYHGVSYGPKVASVAEFSDKAIVVNSFSKYYLLPGWRLGWTVMADDLAAHFSAISANFFISPAAISQYAALAAFNHKEQLDQVVKDYAVNRRIMLEELPRAGFDDLAPADGAFYIYADVSRLTNDSRDFCRRMMHEIGVVAVPGIDFDRENGHHFVRFSFSGQESRVREAMERLKGWLAVPAKKQAL